MTKHLIIALGLMASVAANAQNKTYKTTFGGSEKKVQITSASNQLKVEGYTGTEVIIELEQDENNRPPKEAEGLRLVTPNGVDNTGIGATATAEGNTLKITLGKSRFVGNYKIKIPKETALSIKETGNASGRQWLITGLAGEVNLNTTYNEVMIKDVSGPIVAKSGYGKISVVYDKVTPNKPNSIYGSGPVDITLPADTKANLSLKSSWAEVFTDFDLVPVKTEEKKTKKTTITSADGTKTEVEQEAQEPAMVIGDGSVNVATAVKVEAGVASLSPLSPTAARSSTNRSISNGASKATGGGTSWGDAASGDCNCPEESGNKYTINGGGSVKISLRSDYGNVYLRKKK